MVQTFQGHFQEGRFVSTHNTTIPECVEVFIIVTGNPIQAKANEQRLAFDEFTKKINEAAPLGEEFDEIIAQGINFRKEITL
ncbi:MAG: hypothetical protein FWC16_08195 [Defluviitaleaceae bacterium]|nr:hypothetical protein [Defluviitaleaceae bacterium]MCL2274890.1 hypothetical protein [Defluviitaleaceae bacterium]